MGGNTICNSRGNIPSAISMIRGIMDWEDVNSKGTEEYIGDRYKHELMKVYCENTWSYLIKFVDNAENIFLMKRLYSKQTYW